MKPKPIFEQQDTLIYRKMSLETPIGKLESDSGNHFIDIISIIVVIAILYTGKKMIDKCSENFKL